MPFTEVVSAAIHHSTAKGLSMPQLNRHTRRSLTSHFFLTYRGERPDSSRIAPIIATITAIVVVVCSATSMAAADLSSTLTVRGEVVDGDGQPLPCRLTIRGADGQWRFPRSASPHGSAIAYRRERSPQSVAMHTTLSADPFLVDLPPGEYVFAAERGKEYLPNSVTVRLAEGQSPNVRIELRRWIDMAALGWHSGDVHVHQPLADMPNHLLAEDLNVAFPLSHWVTTADIDPTTGNRVKDPIAAGPPIPQAVDLRHVIYPLNTEYEIFTVGGKSHTLGAVLAIGHRNPFTQKAPPLAVIAEQTHREGGLLDLEKHSWPWSIAIVPIMSVDLFELSNNHVWQTEFGYPDWTIEAAPDYMRLERSANGLTEWGWIDFGFQTYYALLNCGFRLRPSAGTAAGVHPVPVGFSRVYVETPAGFSYGQWLAGLKAGRSFVTNGPLLLVTVNRQPPGDVIHAASPRGEYAVQGAVESLAPIDRVDVIVNGQIDTTLYPTSAPRPQGGFHTPIASVVSVDRSGWVAVRAFEQNAAGRVRFAHSSPVFIEVAGRPLLPRREEIEYLTVRVREEITRNEGVVSREALDEFRRALEFYESIAAKVR